MNSAAMVTRSSLELMLESIRRSHEQTNDLPPALPLRPASKGRLPRPRRCLISSARVGDADFGQECKARDEGEENGRALVKKEKTWFGSEIGVLEARRFNSEPLEESCLSNETSKLLQHRHSVLVIQKCFRGHRARLYHRELENGVTTLQSFVLGENVRKNYRLLIRRREAVIIIQKHVKKWIARVALKHRDRAITLLQSAIRGWLTRKHLSYVAHSEKKFSESSKEFSWVRSSVLVELQNRVVKAEEALEKKEDENAILQQRLLQSDKRWSEYEAKMKAMEETWQKQLTSLQTSLGDKKDTDVGERANKPGPGSATPVQYSTLGNFQGTPCLTPDFGPALTSNGGSRVVACLEREFERQERAFNDDAGTLTRVTSEPVAGGAPMDSIEQLRKLKLRFEAWKKDYKNRLRETKTVLQKIGHSGSLKSRRKWWGTRSARGMLGF